MNWKTPVTLVVLLVILLGSAYYGWQAVTETATSATPTTPTTTPKTTKCKHTTTRKAQRVQATDIVVNVYNAGSVSGLASATSSDLSAKGFQSGEVTDAPAGVQATNVTILAKATRSPEVRLVANQFEGPVAFRKDDIGPGVDVVVGDAFQAVDAQAKPFLVLRKTVRRPCTPSRR